MWWVGSFERWLYPCEPVASYQEGENEASKWEQSSPLWWDSNYTQIGLRMDKISEGFYYIFEHNRTPSGNNTVTGVQVLSASQVQSIGCRWQAISSCP